MPPDRVTWHLLNWADWMRSGRSVDRLPRRSIAIGNSASSSFDDMADASDIRSATATDAVISDLPINQSAALHRKYLNTPYRQHGNYLDTLYLAIAEVGRRLDSRGIY